MSRRIHPLRTTQEWGEGRGEVFPPFPLYCSMFWFSCSFVIFESRSNILIGGLGIAS